jgi:hypothetical protein
MSERRTVFSFALGLVVLLVLLNVANIGKPSAPTPLPTSATPTVGSSSSAPNEAGCPAGLELPDDVEARVCRSVDDADLTALRPTEDPSTGTSIIGFRSPSGSIACADVRGRTVACAVKDWTFDAANVDESETLVLSAGPPLPSADIRPPAAAVDDPETFAVPRLQFGQIVRMNAGWFCSVQPVGVSCWSPTADSGVFVSRSQWTTWGPEGIERAS